MHAFDQSINQAINKSSRQAIKQANPEPQRVRVAVITRGNKIKQLSHEKLCICLTCKQASKQAMQAIKPCIQSSKQAASQSINAIKQTNEFN